MVMVCTVRKFESGNLVLDGGNKTDSCMLINPVYLKDFDLKENDVVKCNVGYPYSYIEIIAKKIPLKNNREAWEYKDKTKVLCITHEDDIDFWKKNKQYLYRNIENFRELLNAIYI
jgi:hypothetical protein